MVAATIFMPAFPYNLLPLNDHAPDRRIRTRQAERFFRQIQGELHEFVVSQVHSLLQHTIDIPDRGFYRKHTYARSSPTGTIPRRASPPAGAISKARDPNSEIRNSSLRELEAEPSDPLAVGIQDLHSQPLHVEFLP